MRKFFARLWKEQRGQDTTEYALLLVLVSLAAITATKTLSTSIQKAFSGAQNTVTSATAGIGNGGGGDGGDGGDGGGRGGRGGR